MESSSIYIPLDRRHAIAHGQTLPDRAAGAALLADISGFTPLTEALTRALGPQRGVEELTYQLDTVYDAVIAEVERYHGSVISFSGDAITCWFDGDNPLAARRATASALAVQTVMRRFAAMPLPGGGSVNLAMKAAVASGGVRRFVVGDPKVQLIDVLAGATLDRLAAAEHLAQKGEVVLSAETVAALGEALTIIGWHTADGESDDQAHGCAIIGEQKAAVEPAPWPALSADSLTEEQIRPWLLPDVYHRLRGGQGAFLAELRPAVALFLQFSGIEYDHDPAAAQKLDAFIQWVQNVVAYYEGSLLQLTIDDKGSYLYAAFGAPLAHEDDPARGVASARILSTPPAELSFIEAIHIGLTQGRMRAGPYGGSSRRTYGVMGNDVNLAARLMGVAAPGQVIVSERIARAATEANTWEPLSPVIVKGVSEPIPIYSLSAIQPPTHHRARTRPLQTSLLNPPIVGRATERATLAESLHALGKGESRVLIIEGEAGIGKSRLVGDLLEQALDLGLAQLLGAGDAIEKSTPYHAWRPVYGQIFQLDTLPDDLEQRRAQILTLLPAETHDRAPLLNAVLPLDWPESELTAQMTDGQVRADNTRELLLGILQQAISRNPTVLVLEDTHWFDSASWALTLAVSRRAHPLLAVIVARPLSEPLPAGYLQLIETPQARRLWLDALSAEDTVSLVCRRLGVAALPEAVSRLIQEKAEGHPFFSEELAYALRDAGSIQVDVERGACRVTPGVNLNAIAFPDTVQGVITSRIDHLTPQQQLTLKAASVIGRVFPFRTLRDIHPVEDDKPALAVHLEGLARLDLTLLETPEPELAYFFKHVITQEVVYNLMLFAQRRQLHRAVAEWHESAYADNLSPYYPVLAYHWSKAEDKLKTIEYLDKAGERAMSLGAFQEAIGFFAEALALDAGPRSMRQARWLSHLAHAYRTLAQPAECRRYVEQAIALLDRPLPNTGGQAVFQILGQLAIQIAHQLWPNRFIGRATSAERDALLQAAYVYEDLMSLSLLGGAPQTLLFYVALRNANATGHAGVSMELIIAYDILGLIAGLSGLHALAERYLRQSAAFAHQIKSAAALGWVLGARALYYSGIGRWTQAIRDARQAAETLERSGNMVLWFDTYPIQGAAEFYAGEYAASAQCYQRIYETQQRHGDNARILGGFGLGWVMLRQGDTDQARTLLETVHAVGPRRVSEYIATLGTLCLVHLRQGNWQAAAECSETAAEWIAKYSPPSIYSTLEGYKGAAETALALWEREPANTQYQRKAQKACQGLWDYCRVFPVGRADAWRCQGLYHWLNGKPAQARAAWHKAIAAGEKYQMPYELGQACYELGRHAEDGERQTRLTRAVEIFERLGAAYDAGQARAALAPSP